MAYNDFERVPLHYFSHALSLDPANM